MCSNRRQGAGKRHNQRKQQIACSRMGKIKEYFIEQGLTPADIIPVCEPDVHRVLV